MPESPPVYYLNEDRRCAKAIHDFAIRYSATDADAPPPVAVGPAGRPVEIFTYADGSADACRRPLGTVLRRVIDRGAVSARDVVVLTPRSSRSSWLMSPSGDPVETWPYQLVPEYGPERAVPPPPTRGNEVRVATIHRYEGWSRRWSYRQRSTGGCPPRSCRGCSTSGPREHGRILWASPASPRRTC